MWQMICLNYVILLLVKLVGYDYLIRILLRIYSALLQADIHL